MTPEPAMTLLAGLRRKTNMCGMRMHGRDDGRILGGFILVALGIMFFMGIGVWWPLFILVPGLMMLVIAGNGGPVGAAVFSIPGMIVAGTGALLLTQALTGYWESWAYAWTLYVSFLGLGLMLMGNRFDERGLIDAGRVVVKIGIGLFAGFALLFEIIFNIGGHTGLVPVMLIALGAYLLLRDRTGSRLLAGEARNGRAKSKRKTKRSEDVLFTGPIVYGSRVPRNGSRLNIGDAEDIADAPLSGDRA